MLITFLITLTGLAQNSQPASQIATLAVQSRQLRFGSRRPVEYLRLQVHDQAGSLIHDSGIIPNSDIVWSLKDGHGNALQGGLYDWKLTVKEPSEASPRVKRGQLNLENANEPNSAGSPVQTPVTVTSGSGTVGAIPIWNTPTELGDSVIAQLNGNVAIGSEPGANIRLRVYITPEDRNATVAIQAVLQTSNDDEGVTTGNAVAGHAMNRKGSTTGVTGVSHSNIGIGVHGAALHEPEETDPPNQRSRGKGVLGSSLSTEGMGVEGLAKSTTGVNIGVRGESLSQTGIGVYGIASEATGANIGVKGESLSPNGYAGYFVGNVEILGNLSKATGSFKIDHPLDPENKTLTQSRFTAEAQRTQRLHREKRKRRGRKL